MPRLFILRHAKSVASTHAAPDHDRPLAPRGTRSLTKVGARLGHELAGRSLDVVLCSTATRARQTVAGVLPHLGTPAVRTDERLYLGGVDAALEVLRELPNDVDSALVCGHNPGLHELALTLVGFDGAPPALRHELPTAGIVVVDLDKEWTSIGPGAGTLAVFIVPTD